MKFNFPKRKIGYLAGLQFSNEEQLKKIKETIQAKLDLEKAYICPIHRGHGHTIKAQKIDPDPKCNYKYQEGPNKGNECGNQMVPSNIVLDTIKYKEMRVDHKDLKAAAKKRLIQLYGKNPFSTFENSSKSGTMIKKLEKTKLEYLMIYRAIAQMAKNQDLLVEQIRTIFGKQDHPLKANALHGVGYIGRVLYLGFDYTVATKGSNQIYTILTKKKTERGAIVTVATGTMGSVSPLLDEDWKKLDIKWEAKDKRSDCRKHLELLYKWQQTDTANYVDANLLEYIDQKVIDELSWCIIAINDSKRKKHVEDTQKKGQGHRCHRCP